MEISQASKTQDFLPLWFHQKSLNNIIWIVLYWTHLCFLCSENCIHTLLLIAKPIIYLCGCTSCVCSEILRHNIKSLHEQTEPVIAISPCEWIDVFEVATLEVFYIASMEVKAWSLEYPDTSKLRVSRPVHLFLIDREFTYHIWTMPSTECSLLFPSEQ